MPNEKRLDLINKWDVVNKLIRLEFNYYFYKDVWDAQTLYRRICELEIGIGKTPTVDAVEVVHGWMEGMRMATCKDCEFGGSCVMLHKSDSQVCNTFTHKKDYVEVVRCKDCKFWKDDILRDDGEIKCCFIGMYMTKGDNYCSFGKRRDDNA